MACSCKKRVQQQFRWTSADGQTTIVYPTETQAKAKKIRAGGDYVALRAGE